MLLWLDLETTGLDARKNRILEVGWTLTQDDLCTHLIGVRHHVVTPTLETLDQLDTFNEELDMHLKNGLDHEVRTSATTMMLEDIEDEILADIAASVKDETPVYLAGFGIHFDRRWIEEWMPRLHARLHYRILEMSSISRFYGSFPDYSLSVEATVEAADDTGPAPAHRVETDILLAIVTARALSEITMKAFAAAEILHNLGYEQVQQHYNFEQGPHIDGKHVPTEVTAESLDAAAAGVAIPGMTGMTLHDVSTEDA